MKRSIILSIALLTFTLLFAGCSQEMEQSNKNDYLLGTIIQIDITAVRPEEKIEHAFEIISNIEKKMSLNIGDSEISQINDAAGKNPVQVSDDTFTVIERALEYARLSEGKFDPSIGPIVDLWGISGDYVEVEEGESRVPSQAEIESRLELVGHEMVEIDPEKNEVFLQKEGMMLDIGGIAKGYAADRVTEFFATSKEVQGGYISLGGAVSVFGDKEDGSFWRVGIQDPVETRGTPLARVELKDKAVDTSGNYERYFVEDGVRYHHILSTEDGYPVDAGVVSATVVTESSFEADVISTTIFISGVEKGLELVDSIDGVETMIVTKDNKVYISEGMNQKLKILNEDYQLREF